MEVECPYCGEDVWFERDVWDEMRDGDHATGNCPECDAYCCFTCGRTYEPGTIRTPSPREPEFIRPSYPF